MLRGLAFVTILTTSIAGLLGLPWWIIGLCFAALSTVSCLEASAITSRSAFSSEALTVPLADALPTLAASGAAFALGTVVRFLALS